MSILHSLVKNSTLVTLFFLVSLCLSFSSFAVAVEKQGPILTTNNLQGISIESEGPKKPYKQSFGTFQIIQKPIEWFGKGIDYTVKGIGKAGSVTIDLIKRPFHLHRKTEKK